MARSAPVNSVGCMAMSRAAAETQPLLPSIQECRRKHRADSIQRFLKLLWHLVLVQPFPQAVMSYRCGPVTLLILRFHNCQPCHGCDNLSRHPERGGKKVSETSRYCIGKLRFGTDSTCERYVWGQKRGFRICLSFKYCVARRLRAVPCCIVDCIWLALRQLLDPSI